MTRHISLEIISCLFFQVQYIIIQSNYYYGLNVCVPSLLNSYGNALPHNVTVLEEVLGRELGLDEVRHVESWFAKIVAVVQLLNHVQLCHLMDYSQSRLHSPSPSLRVCSNSYPLSWWCHPTISSSVIPFSSRFQSFPASGSISMSRLFKSGGQSIGVSASASVLSMNIQGWYPLGWMGWISLQSKGLARVSLQHHSLKASILWCSAFFMVQLSHPYMTTGKTTALIIWTLVGKVISLCFLIHWLGLS